MKKRNEMPIEETNYYKEAMWDLGTKVCKTCGEEKPLSEFTISPKNKGGYKPSCIICTSEYFKEWRRLNDLGIKVTKVSKAPILMINTCSYCKSKFTETRVRTLCEKCLTSEYYGVQNIEEKKDIPYFIEIERYLKKLRAQDFELNPINIFELLDLYLSWNDEYFKDTKEDFKKYMDKITNELIDYYNEKVIIVRKRIQKKK
jgi:hypothetical protein